MEAVYRLLDYDKLPLRIKLMMTIMRNPFSNFLMVGLGNMFINGFLPNTIVRKLSKEEHEFYSKPYPTLKSRKPLRIWPQEIAVNGKPAHTHKIISSYHEWLKKTEIPKICFYAEGGMLIPKHEIPWIEANLPNTKTINIGEGKHFIQEDNPQKIGEELSNWYQDIDR